MPGTTVELPDRRTLAVETSGSARGKPVFLLHGTPGSRLGQAPRGALLTWMGIRLITFDRPGYGDSDRLPGRRVADGAADVAAVADALGLKEFAVVGRSGGAPHAMACAALLPDRVTRTAVLVSLAPRDAAGLDWYAGMAPANVRDHSSALDGSLTLAPSLRARSRDIRSDPYRLVAALKEEMPDSDRRMVADQGVRVMLQNNFREAMRSPDAGGWIDDVVAFNQHWGFDPADIPGPVLIWHGEDDVFCPAEHARWLAERIPRSILRIERGAAHFGVLRRLPQILPWAAR
ncbi:alpha/beta fold hydrolase [Streptacidiphilus cavernicola]|uniref:Alpha/beta fold hydrolase n=1 Tax=Streptacidiphilus cavernicola TaxID=3342716 RepID=A0ABV6VNL8_9ACTN